MFDILQQIPQQIALYQLALFLTVGLIVESACRLKELRWGFAALVFCTIGLWYFIDPVYRPDDYTYEKFAKAEQDKAYLQVIIFLLSFRMFVEILVPKTSSQVLRAYDPKIVASHKIAKTLLFSWIVLFLIGISRMEFDAIGALFPVKSRANWGHQLWARPRFGGTSAFLVSIGMYSYMMICAGFGMVAVATKSRRVRTLMSVMVILTWPMFLLSGTRHYVIAVALPSILAVLILKPWSRAKQLIFLATIAISLNFCFLVVIKYRDTGLAGFIPTTASTYDDPEAKEQKHLGLNMPQELFYINRYQDEGSIDIEWGANYLEHAVNFIPRAIWPNKPFPGKDFSVLRVGYHRGEVAATISLGIIGQGVSNFGPWFGPVAPAFLLSVLAIWLCRLPYRGNTFLRICLILLVLGTVPNLGRDLTLFALWPTIFGYVGIRFYESTSGNRNMQTRSVASR